MDYKKHWEKALTISTYYQQLEDKANNPDDWEYGQYIPLNLVRTKRLIKTFKLNADDIEFITKSKKQYWLVISEHWCGDAAQIVPVMNKIAEQSKGLIEIRIILRDEYPDLINAHLTNNGKAVPKLIQLNSEFNLIKDWGPRPIEAQKIVDDWKKDPDNKPHYAETLHKWYATDKQQGTKKELLKVIHF
jgi:hypothetical protein